MDFFLSKFQISGQAKFLRFFSNRAKKFAEREKLLATAIRKKNNLKIKDVFKSQILILSIILKKNYVNMLYFLFGTLQPMIYTLSFWKSTYF